eukprot:243994-Rhodomonas_salina.3
MGRKGDHQYCSAITLPDCTTIIMIFHNCIWRSPTLTRQTAVELHHHKYISTIKGAQTGVKDTNPYSSLLELAYESEPHQTSLEPADKERVDEVDRK